MIAPSDFHAAADQIVGKRLCTGEAGARTACGRAYYAVYLTYRAAIRNQVNDQEYDFNHESLKKAINRPRLHWKVMKLGGYVRPLSKWRTDSDYNPSGLTVNDTDAIDRTKEANAALQLIEELVRQGEPLPVPTRKVREL